jgi:hypothetical protein
MLLRLLLAWIPLGIDPPWVSVVIHPHLDAYLRCVYG